MKQQKSIFVNQKGRSNRPSRVGESSRPIRGLMSYVKKPKRLGINPRKKLDTFRNLTKTFAN